jgi:hypothetical protein
MPRRRSAGRIARAGPAPTDGFEPDARAREAMRCFVRVLARCGCAPRIIEYEVGRACREIPKSWWHKADVRDRGAPAHVMTLWFSDPEYLDARGKPRPLPLRGRLSIEALARRVDPTLDAELALRYLMRGGGLRRIGRRYVPRDRVLIFRGPERMNHFERLRGLFGLLSTMDYNSRSTRETAGRFDVLSWNPRFPVRERAAFDRRVRQLGNPFLVQMDADMHRLERTRKKGERTVALGVGVYRFEETPLRRGRRRPRRRPRRQRE